jgi:hypothetical protein
MLKPDGSYKKFWEDSDTQRVSASSNSLTAVMNDEKLGVLKASQRVEGVVVLPAAISIWKFISYKSKTKRASL